MNSLRVSPNGYTLTHNIQNSLAASLCTYFVMIFHHAFLQGLLLQAQKLPTRKANDDI